MSKKELDRRFHFPHQGEANKCPKCKGTLKRTAQAGSMPPSLKCTACGWRDWDMKGCKPDWDVIRSAQSAA